MKNKDAQRGIFPAAAILFVVFCKQDYFSHNKSNSVNKAGEQVWEGAFAHAPPVTRAPANPDVLML